MIFDEWWRVVWQIPWGHFPWWMMAIHDQTKDLPIPGIQTSTTTVEVEHCDVLVDFDLLISSRGRCGWRSDANGGGRFGRVGEAPEILKKNRWNKNKLAPGGFFPKWRFYLGGFCTWPFQGWKVTWSKPSRDQKVKEAGGKDSGWFWRCLKLPAWQGCWKVSKVLGSGMIRFRRVPIRFQQFQETNGWRARLGRSWSFAVWMVPIWILSPTYYLPLFGMAPELISKETTMTKVICICTATGTGPLDAGRAQKRLRFLLLMSLVVVVVDLMKTTWDEKLSLSVFLLV